jgi:hypothetical protein
MLQNLTPEQGTKLTEKNMGRQARFLARKNRDELTAMAFPNAERETGIRSGPGAHRASDVLPQWNGSSWHAAGEGRRWNGFMRCLFLPPEPCLASSLVIPTRPAGL